MSDLVPYESTDLTPVESSKEIIPTIHVQYRTWRSEPDGQYDRQVDIWYNNNWVPAYFSDIRRGDFFLDVKLGDIGKDRCYLAKSDVKRIKSIWPESDWRHNDPSFQVQGLEIVQAPAIKDITPLSITTEQTGLLE